ncbi:hypothetical protein T265_09308 [Opisthorchis viverrini]|uniref:Uncharacterized protein n=1 Tax=Opisthorchis viverrini TaxID=6198 RepID=A0A074ZAS9_OPIVI|nr:hypothetical protein T265_09308 [Opisthorchis viverrini]KER22647.1 hypothetical protein T265_09308 [Opisthorchis viverrini]
MTVAINCLSKEIVRTSVSLLSDSLANHTIKYSLLQCKRKHSLVIGLFADLGTWIVNVSSTTEVRSKLLTSLLKTLRQPTTGFALLLVHRVGAIPEFLSTKLHCFREIHSFAKIDLVSREDSIESPVYDVLQLNVLHTGRLMIQVWQLPYKRFLSKRLDITSPMVIDIISAFLGSARVRSAGLVVVPTGVPTVALPNNALMMSPQLVMKRLQSNFPAQRTSQRPRPSSFYRNQRRSSCQLVFTTNQGSDVT